MVEGLEARVLSVVTSDLLCRLGFEGKALSCSGLGFLYGFGVRLVVA